MPKEEFEQIYRQYYAKMYRLAYSMLYDADESKDAVSDVFARLLRSGSLPQSDKIEGYLMMSIQNQCRNIISHRSIRERVEKMFTQELSQSIVIPVNDDDRMERLKLFINAELPPLTKKIFQLRFLKELSYEEIAQATGVSKVTVYNHLSQSLKRVHEYFKNK